MSDLKCVVEGCSLEYDVVCSFSFYNVNSTCEEDPGRHEWIEGAMQEEKECLWRHVSLQLCGYHFELDTQGLWIDSPMLPELLTRKEPPPAITPTEADKKAAVTVRLDHNYCVEKPREEPSSVSRLNVRQLVDTLGYLSLKNLQRKQLWVVKVETDKAEASITQSEQIITKMTDPKQIIEIIPQSSLETTNVEDVSQTSEVLEMIEEDSSVTDNFIYEIAEEQEITMDEVKEIPSSGSQEWMVNIIPEESKPKYAYIKHCNTGKKKRHFTAEMNEIALQGDFENYYILPDVDPSSSVEISTSYEPETYIVQEYDHLVLEERPKKRGREPKDDTGKKRKKRGPQTKVIKSETGEDWIIENSYEDDDYDDKKKDPSRVRRKNKKYLGYDFVT